MNGKMMSVDDATAVREILDKAVEENRTHMWIVRQLSISGFQRNLNTHSSN